MFRRPLNPQNWAWAASTASTGVHHEINSWNQTNEGWFEVTAGLASLPDRWKCYCLFTCWTWYGNTQEQLHRNGWVRGADDALFDSDYSALSRGGWALEWLHCSCLSRLLSHSKAGAAWGGELLTLIQSPLTNWGQREIWTWWWVQSYDMQQWAQCLDSEERYFFCAPVLESTLESM